MEATDQFSADRVRENTLEKVNLKIDQETQQNILYYSSMNKLAIKGRIHELDREWDVERVLELNASLLALSGVILGAVVDKKWLILPTVVTGFLAQHAIQGWCPPLPIFRRMGIRTRKEIDKERFALIDSMQKKEW